MLAAMLLSACASTLYPPPLTDQPTPVYVLDHGRHNSLVLVVDDDRVMRYVFGEWRWYVDGETGLLRSIDALFRPTPSALGRIRLLGPPDPDCWVDQVRSVIFSALAFNADRERVRDLADSIDAHFAAPDAQPHFSRFLNLEFVMGPHPYSLRFNSNHQVVAWLETLGFEVRGSPALGLLRPNKAQRAYRVADAEVSPTVAN